MYEAKNYEHLIGLTGMSDGLLTTHFGLYEGYVKNTNAVHEQLTSLAPDTREYADISRRFAWEWNGMRLHEVYFGVMSKEPTAFDAESALGKKIVGDFGSYENWVRDFTGKAAIRGIGWGILAYDADGDRLMNLWISEHDQGHMAGAVPLAAIDVFEHAFMADYGTDRGSYIDAFMSALDWRAVAERYGT